MRPVPSRLVRIAPLLLAVSALAALLLPYAMQAWSPPGAPGRSYAEMQARVHMGRVLAALFTATAVSALALRFSVDAEGATRQAIFLGMVGFILAGAAILPIYDGLEATAIHHQYTKTRTLEPEEAAWVQGFGGGPQDVVYKAYALQPASRDAPLVLGPLPVTRGDAWRVLVYALEEKATVPRLSAPGVTCELDAVLDGRQAHNSHVGVAFHCTATRTGVTELTVRGGGDVARNHEVVLYASPVLHNAYLRSVDETVALHAAGFGLSSFTLLYWVRRIRPAMAV